MKIELIYNETNEIVGYKLIKEETDSTKVINTIRRMHFLNGGLDKIVYGGRTSDNNDDTIELRFYTKQHDNYLNDHKNC